MNSSVKRPFVSCLKFWFRILIILISFNCVTTLRLQQTSDEHEGRVRELISAVEELQKLLKLATDAQEELEVNNKKMEATYTTEKEELGQWNIDDVV